MARERVNPFQSNNGRLAKLSQTINNISQQIASEQTSNPSTDIDEVYEAKLILYNLERAMISAGISNVVKTGAMTTATIAAANGFDQLTVTGGDYSSNICLSNLSYGAMQFHIKASIQVNTLNQNGTTGSSYLGLGLCALTIPWDLTPVGGISMAFDLVGKTNVVSEKYGSQVLNDDTANSGMVGSIVYKSGDFNVVAGDVLDLDFYVDNLTQTMYLTIVNRKDKSYVKLKSVNGVGILQNNQQIHGAVKLIASNGKYTILDLSLETDVNVATPLYITGDSYMGGNHIAFNQSVAGYFINDPDYRKQIVYAASSGGQIQGIASVQVNGMAQLKPKYTLIGSVLNQYFGYFITGNGNNATFLIHWNKLVHYIKDSGAVPVYLVWPNGGYAANADAYYSFIQTQQSIFGGIIVDARTIVGSYDDSNHPSEAFSFTIYSKIKAAIS